MGERPYEHLAGERLSVALGRQGSRIHAKAHCQDPEPQETRPPWFCCLHKYLFKPTVGSNARTTLNLRGNAGRVDYGQGITVGSSSAKTETKKRCFKVRDLDPATAWSCASPAQRVYVHHQVPAW